jgi:hypothetical protein
MVAAPAFGVAKTSLSSGTAQIGLRGFARGPEKPSSCRRNSMMAAHRVLLGLRGW